MKTILVVTDSLSLPRSSPEDLRLEETWPELLKNKGFNVIRCSIGGATIEELKNQASYYANSKPDYFILQSGIVDCAPRALKYQEELIFSYLHLNWLKNVIFSKYGRQIRRARNICKTNPNLFQKTVDELLNLFSYSQCFCISIAPVSPEYEHINPRITLKVNQYNEILHKLFCNNYIDITTMPYEYLMSDFHHLRKLGHLYVFEKIMSQINDYIN